MTEVIEGHVVGEELEPVAPRSTTLFGTNDPSGVVASASLAAKSLAKAVVDQKLTVPIQGKQYVRVEGWTMLGSMLGVFPVVKEDHKLSTDGGGWEAYVEARTRAGEVVGGAWAQCTRSEKQWSQRDDYALRSMAQTRATSKALRMPLGFVMALAGFEATPAEEMPTGPLSPPAKVVKPTKAQLTKLNEALDLYAGGDMDRRDRMDVRIYELYGTTTVEDLSKDQVDELLEKVKAS